MKVIEGRITSGFGDRVHPITGQKSFHNGIDIAAVVGTAIYSPIDGVVVDVYDREIGGKSLIIGDKNTLRFGFAHLSKVIVKIGDQITKKQLIAKSGNTGISTGPHLHFTAKTGGRWVGSTYVGGQFVDSEPYLIIK